MTDLDSATRFADKSMAENILQRATKKLKGFELKEVEEITAEKPRRRGRKPKQVSEQVEAPAAAEAEAEQAQEKKAESEEKKAPARARKGKTQEEKDGQTAQQEKQPRRRGRKPKQQPAPAEAPAAQEAVEEAPAQEPAASVLPPSFKMEIHSAAKDQAVKETKEKEVPVKEVPEDAQKDEEAPAAQAEEKKDEAPAEKTGRRGGRSRRGRRSRSTQEHAQEQKQETQSDAPVKEEADIRSEQAQPEKEPEGASVIPMFTIQTHHVSENAVAKPVAKREKQEEKAAQRQDEPKPVQAETTEGKGETGADRAAGTGRRGRGRNSARREEPQLNATDIHEEEAAPKESAAGNGRGRGRRSQNQEVRHQDIFESESARDSQTRAGSDKGKRGAASDKSEKTESAAKSERGGRTRRGPKVSATEAKRRIFTQQERYEIYNRTEGHCGICGKFIPLGEYTIDHIIPLSKGGTNDLENLQACCSFCNKAKDDSVGDEFFQRIENIFLYQTQLRYGKKKLKKLKRTLEEFEEI